MTRITIDPITRLEGHGRIEILLDETGEVRRTYFQVPELRGFESFCVGRPVEEMPVLTNRICGVCPEAHHLASAKACDAVYDVVPPRPARLLREALYSAFFVADHTTHFYALGGPDLFVGPDAPVAERNLLGVIRRVGMEVGGRVIEARRGGHRVVELIGGRRVHPCTAVPGGQTKRLTEVERAEVEAIGHWMVEFAASSLELFDRRLAEDPGIAELLLGDLYTHETYYAGLVDEAGRVAFYDGRVRVVAPDGEPLGTYAPAEYRDWIAERVEPWTYLKFPYLRQVGWKGFVDGPDSGVYCVGPLGRLNAATGMATLRAQAEYERYFATLAPAGDGRRRLVHQRGATHWARLVEMLYAAERLVELARDPEITSDDIRAVPSATPTEGVGTVEAPRGTLTHHYWTDERGLVTQVNLIVGTTNNHAPIAMSIDRAARGLIHAGTVVGDGLLDRIEMAFRAYDPCFGCATHHLPGHMPLEVTIRDAAGEIVDVLRRDG
ncbi:MAG TPA: Ni/Fe hydrogenase subunit alpha [Candidatus Dormibacteraeota bacterium]|nr:Ni/Fe hydrogenase subunit alpha [Candidatus Dormibacteraeota bacterium]